MHSTRRSRTALVALLALATLLPSGAALAATPSGDPSVSPVSSPVAPTPDPVDGAIPAVPNADIVDATARPWDHISVSPDGRTLTVYFWNGVSGCYGLKDVLVSEQDGVLTVTVETGMLPEAISRTCEDIALLYKTDVTLDQPLILGGAV